ncbi:hypothetical protein B0T17DRAFT_490680 [Bombardia bombarda]|uniref:Uncharacterized protein n=1 Tax=Bombardia bombarda TaxID=252184 RepID=A0AA39XCK6_9PEZI|nr:hypothetical protein B0T17DRAFT_490680 [Bombardia bombarda]
MDSESLIRLLRKFDASSSLDATAVRAVRAAFEHVHVGSGTDARCDDALVDWATRHVTPDTLLSADELSQFAALEKSGLADTLVSSTDLATVQPFNDQDLKDAIDELNRSTEAISRQTETLKQQHDALDRLVKGSRKDEEARSALESRQSQRLNAHRSSLAVAVEELSQALDAKILDIEQQSKADSANIQQTVDSLFRSDDKLLSSLQKLGWELETEDPEEQDNVVMLRETCARLIKFTVEGIRTKLDRIYLESLESSTRSAASRRVRSNEVSALQEELESLYAEILPVAQMSVEQQFLDPALKNLESKNGHGLARSEQAVRYIQECFDYLLDHVEELSAGIEASQAYQLAASALTSVARAELAAKIELPANRERRATVGASPTRRRSLNHGSAVSPVRASAKPRSARRSSGISGEIGDDLPLEEILRGLAISLPQDESSFAGVRAQVDALATTLAERKSKVQDVARNVQGSFEAATIKQIADAKLAIQIVRDSILAENPFGQVRLVDPEIEGLIAVLAQELEAVRAKLEGVDTSLVKARGKSIKKEGLIQRWGS